MMENKKNENLIADKGKRQQCVLFLQFPQNITVRILASVFLFALMVFSEKAVWLSGNSGFHWGINCSIRVVKSVGIGKWRGDQRANSDAEGGGGAVC